MTLYLTDPVLRRIAAATADVWPDRMWRFDTAKPGTDGELAKLLHETSLLFADSTELIGLALAKAGDDISRTQEALAKDGHLHLLGTDQHFTDTLAAIERHRVLEQQLLGQYAAWRTCNPTPTAATHFHLLVKAGDPSYGVVQLAEHGQDRWQVFPDSGAAIRFAIGYADHLIGDITSAAGVFQPTAYINPMFPSMHPQLGYRLPGCHDMQAAIRSLLRWWAICDSASWDRRTPDQLDPAELAALAE